MRDPNRIEKVLATLKEVWMKNPDLRLGQLVVIATTPKEPCPEVFYIEDNKLEDGLKRFEARCKDKE